MKAIVLITLRPHSAALEFFRTLKRDGYDLFVVVDDNGFPCESDEVLTYIKYDARDCIRRGFTGANFMIRRSGPTGWDKAIRYFCACANYEHVWFIEDDVFVPRSQAIADIDARHGDAADILSASDIVNSTGTMDWHWRHVMGKLSLPWSRSMVCAVRLSRAVLAGVLTYVGRHRSLNFIEFLFHTIALHRGLTVKAIPELEAVVWRRVWTLEEIEADKLYHPVKDILVQQSWRESMGLNRRSPCQSNEGRTCQLVSRIIR